MATVGDGLQCGNYKAAADLRGKQFYCCAKTSSGINLAADGGNAFGILMDNSINTGQPAPLTIKGMTKAMLGGTVADQDLLTVDATSRLVAQTDAADLPVARAMSAGTVGAIIEIEFIGNSQGLTE